MSVDDLNRRLYDRNSRLNGIRRSRLSVARGEGPSSWDSNSEPAVSTMGAKRKFSWPVKILIGSVAVFILTLLAALIIMFGNVSVVSDNDITVVIQGPSSIKAGEEVPITIAVTNKNTVPLESAELAIVYPSGTKDAAGAPLTRERRPLGTVLSGSTENVVLKAIIYGPESSEQKVQITLEYRLSGSNAVFQKESTFETIIGSPSINISTSLPSEITSNQPIEIEVKLVSNDRQTLNNVLVNADYPPGFSFKSSVPAPFAGNSIWSLGNLAAGTEKKIVIKGVLEGQDQEIKSFNFSAGEATGEDNESIGSHYAALFRTVTINRPFIATKLSINNSEKDEYIASAGEKIRVDVDWINNLPTDIENAEFKFYLNGNSFDRLSVNAGQAFYQSADNTITWNKNNNSALGLIEPGKFGRVSFSFNMLSANRLAEGGAQAVSVKLVVKGLRVDSNISEREISTEFEKIIKVGSSLQLASRGVYYSGPFANTGPLPPQAGEETTYTIIWSAVNQSNLVRSGVARAVLPDSVRWLGVTSPNTENIKYDEAKKEVIWQLGDVKSGTGSNSPAREASFQVALTPSLSQIGTTAELLGQTTFTGYDTFAEVNVTKTTAAVTTRITSDSKWQSSQEKVVE